MRILYLGNNRLGWQILDYLRGQGETIIGLVLHPEEKRRCGDEMIASAGDVPVFDGSTLRQPETVDAIRALKPDIGISGLFGYILKQEAIDLFPQGCLNIHPSYLPYNRGAYPNVWSIVDGTPAGVTIHYINAGVDTGDIIARQQVEVEPVDTGASLYAKLEQTALDLFKETWQFVRAGQAPRLPQSGEAGTAHRVADVAKIDGIDLDRTYTARELINILRARTFPPYKGAYFQEDGRKVYLRLQLLYEEQLEG